MSRSRVSARKAGAGFERLIADHLAATVDDRIDRRVRTGAKDRGDITGLRHAGRRLVVECKDYAGQYRVGPWLAEAEVERGNDDALAGMVVAKRRGITDPAEQVVFMTLSSLVAILTGRAPSLPFCGDCEEGWLVDPESRRPTGKCPCRRAA